MFIISNRLIITNYNNPSDVLEKLFLLFIFKASKVRCIVSFDRPRKGSRLKFVVNTCVYTIVLYPIVELSRETSDHLQS